jgi:ribonucleoside-diphosphate reductase alpha chain
LSTEAYAFYPVSDIRTAVEEESMELFKRSKKTNPKADEAPVVRRHLPDERQSITNHFSVGGHDGYLTIGLFEDGYPGEVFLTMNKEGSTVSGFSDAWAVGISLQLQYGVPLSKVIEKCENNRFEPMGYTNNPEIKEVSSIVDYVAKYMKLRFAEFLK